MGKKDKGSGILISCDAILTYSTVVFKLCDFLS